MRHWTAVLAVLLGLFSVELLAQQKEAEQKSEPAHEQTVEKSAKLGSSTEANKPAETQQKETPPIVTHHEIHVGGRVLRYTATTGLLPIRNPENDEIEANIFFIAYTLDNAGANRPLMFSFNGGPGSASVWLHLGAIGPRRVKMLPDGSMPPPPFELIDNQQTWLDQTDLVFIDPVGTGYSRATKKDYAKKFFGLKGDISSVGEFIRLYLTRYQRWTSPLFLVGESYGTTRAAGPYAAALAKGDTLSPQERQTILDQLTRFTGLERNVVDLNDLRIKQSVFCRELLRNQRMIVGRLDSRFTGPLSAGDADEGFYDPTMSIIRPPFTATFNNYVRSDLGYKTDLEYYILGGGITEWDWGSAGRGYPDVSESLHEAFVKNPYMKLFVASGYYDLATPFFATEYTLNHMRLDPQQHAKVSLGYYEAGHMMYLRTDSLDHLKQDVSGFLSSSLH